MAVVITSVKWHPVDIEPKTPEHEHEWVFYSHDHIINGPHIHSYYCKCGAWKRTGRDTQITEYVA